MPTYSPIDLEDIVRRRAPEIARDLTIVASNNQIFFKNGEGMPGIFTLSADGKDLAIA